MPAPVLQFKRGNAGVAGTVPALRPGEPAISLNNFDFFIGIDTSVANNKFFGSHRYWGREDGTTSLRVKLVDKDGTNSINLKSPNTLAGITTYTLPETPTNGYLLTTNANGDLSWTNSLPGASFSGITTFTDTTDNTLGNADTGAVQIDGGLGINKNLTVGQNLHVQGYSNFVGVVTFQGGTINLGDDTGDNINIGGEFTSGLYPNTTNTYDFGDSTRQWRHANFAGVGTFSTGAVIDAIQIGITAAGEIDTSTGGLTLDSASGQTIIDDNLSVAGVATVTGAFVANGNVTLGDAAGDTITVNGTTTFTQPLVGTIGTATRATLVDTTTAPNGTFYPGLFVNNTGTASTAVYVDAGISYVSNTDTLTLTGDIAVNGGDVTTSATTFNLINGTATNVNFGGAATALNMGATTGIATINNPTLVGTQATQNLYNTVATNLNFGGAATALVMGATTGVGTIRNTTISFPNATTVSSGAASLTLFNTTATNITGFGAATALNLGATTGIATINNTTLTLPNATTVNVNGANPILASSSTGTLTHFNTNITAVNEYGAATALVVGATSGIATIRNTTFSLPNATAVNVNGANPTFSGTSTGTLTLFNTNLTGVNAFGAATALVMGAATGITTVSNNLTVGGDIRVNGNDIQASDGNTNITLTSNTLTTFAGDIRVNGNDIQASDGNANITMTSNTLTEVKGDLQVTGNDIKSSTGANAISLSGSDVTVNGNLYVNGSTTQVNTAALTVEDRTIDLGIVNGTAPAADTTWDLGVLFNYYSSGAAKKSAVVWEHGDSRFKFASVLASDTDGSNNDTPQLTVTTFAPIEIGALWVNDCAGQSQVISCTGTTRYLENITIDAGQF